MIAVLDVGKTFPGVTALQEVNLTIGDGEFFVIVGPSGCGARRPRPAAAPR
jgi:ABC-type sugar transport system ATPase subunit